MARNHAPDHGTGLDVIEDGHAGPPTMHRVQRARAFRARRPSHLRYPVLALVPVHATGRLRGCSCNATSHASGAWTHIALAIFHTRTSTIFIALYWVCLWLVRSPSSSPQSRSTKRADCNLSQVQQPLEHAPPIALAGKLVPSATSRRRPLQTPETRPQPTVTTLFVAVFPLRAARRKEWELGRKAGGGWTLERGPPMD